MATFTAGYVLVWLAFVAYVGWIAHRQRRLSQRYEALRRELESADHEDRVSKAA